VHLLVLTDGSKGTWDPRADTEQLIATRREEQRAAADALGVREVHFLEFVDGELRHGRDEQAAVCEVIRETRPEVVLGHDPWKRYRLHPDHEQAGRIVIEGIVAARDPHFFPALGDPHRPARLLLFEAGEIDHVEDIMESVDKKIEALLCHRSQWESTHGIHAGSADEATQRAAFEARVHEKARTAGTPAELRVAEAFKRIEPL
jgi:LmbE family N-acetylglucosaminyl deacetylase